MDWIRILESQSISLIRIRIRRKQKNVVLYIGKKDSDQKNYYVQMKGSHMVYLSDKDVVKNILNP